MYEFDDWSPDYANHRLNGTWLFSRRHGLLQYLDSSRSRDRKGLFIVGRSVNGDKIQGMVPGLELVPPKFGLVQYECDRGIDVLFMRRMPLRRDWRQGIRPSQFEAWSARGQQVPNSAVFGNKRGMSMLNNALMRKFDSLEQAVMKTDEEYCACAVSPVFSVTDQGSICYEDAGEVAELEGDRVKLMKKYAFLKERLEKELRIETKV